MRNKVCDVCVSVCVCLLGLKDQDQTDFYVLYPFLNGKHVFLQSSLLTDMNVLYSSDNRLVGDERKSEKTSLAGLILQAALLPHALLLLPLSLHFPPLIVARLLPVNRCFVCC